MNFKHIKQIPSPKFLSLTWKSDLMNFIKITIVNPQGGGGGRRCWFTNHSAHTFWWGFTIFNWGGGLWGFTIDIWGCALIVNPTPPQVFYVQLALCGPTISVLNTGFLLVKKNSYFISGTKERSIMWSFGSKRRCDYWNSRYVYRNYVCAV